MGFSQVLPGLRDVRAHLTAGYLWLFTVWVLLPKIPPSVTGNPLVERVRSAAEDANPAALAVVASVVAYLIGLTFGAVSKVLMLYIVPIAVLIAVQQLTHSLLSIPVLLVLAVLLALLAQPVHDPATPAFTGFAVLMGVGILLGVASLPPYAQVIWTVVALLAAVAMVVFRARLARDHGVRWQAWLACWLVDLIDAAELAGGWLRQQYLLRRRPSVGISNEEILRRNNDTSSSENAVLALPVWRLKYACQYIFARLDDLDGSSRAKELRRQAFLLYADPGVLPVLQRELIRVVSTRDEARGWFLEVVMDGEGFDKARRDYADLIEFALLRDHERAYERLDRLTGESDYRLEIAIPAIAAAYAVTFTLGARWWWGLVGIGIALLLYVLAFDRLGHVRRLLSNALQLADNAAAAPTGVPKVTVEVPSLIDLAAAQHVELNGLRHATLRFWKQPLDDYWGSRLTFELQRLRFADSAGRGDDPGVMEKRGQVAGNLSWTGDQDLAAHYFAQAADWLQQSDHARAADLRRGQAVCLALADRVDEAVAVLRPVLDPETQPLAAIDKLLTHDLGVRRERGLDATATEKALAALDRS